MLYPRFPALLFAQKSKSHLLPDRIMKSFTKTRKSISKSQNLLQSTEDGIFVIGNFFHRSRNGNGFQNPEKLD